MWLSTPPPGHESGRFVEVEDEHGRSHGQNVGLTWHGGSRGYHRLGPFASAAALDAALTERDEAHIVNGGLVAELNRTQDELKRLQEALFDLAEALESVWAAIGDALCSGNGIAKEYSQSIATKAKNAAEKARAIVGWNRASLDVTKGK